MKNTMSLENSVSNKAFTWRIAKAQKLLKDLSESDAETEQYLLARITGNFKRSNEKLAQNMNK